MSAEYRLSKITKYEIKYKYAHLFPFAMLFYLSNKDIIMTHFTCICLHVQLLFICYTSLN